MFCPDKTLCRYGCMYFLGALVGVHGGEVMYFWSVCFRDELGFLNFDDICICIVNKQFELLEFVFEFVHVDLQYDEISFIFTTGSVCL